MKTVYLPVLGRLNQGLIMVHVTDGADEVPMHTSVTVALPGLEWRQFWPDPGELEKFAHALLEAAATKP